MGGLVYVLALGPPVKAGTRKEGCFPRTKLVRKKKARESAIIFTTSLYMETEIAPEPIKQRNDTQRIIKENRITQCRSVARPPHWKLVCSFMLAILFRITSTYTRVTKNKTDDPDSDSSSLSIYSLEKSIL